ncbi:MAG: hypothetical protein AAF725_22545 [Acidobacteriota bacterium]
MGTFHTGKSELHGITVVVETKSDDLYVGRCDDMDDREVILLDADVHHAADETPREQYLANAAQWGVFAKHRRLVIDVEQVVSVRRLGEL